MTEHETDKMLAALARIEARLDKLERVPDRELKVGGLSMWPRHERYTMEGGGILDCRVTDKGARETENGK